MTERLNNKKQKQARQAAGLKKHIVKMILVLGCLLLSSWSQMIFSPKNWFCFYWDERLKAINFVMESVISKLSEYFWVLLRALRFLPAAPGWLWTPLHEGCYYSSPDSCDQDLRTSHSPHIFQMDCAVLPILPWKRPLENQSFHSKLTLPFSLWPRALSFLIRVISTTSGEGNGTPLQYSCLENPMDGGAW